MFSGPRFATDGILTRSTRPPGKLRVVGHSSTHPPRANNRPSYLISPECVLSFPLSSSSILGLLLTLQRGMRTAACCSLGLAAVNGASKVLLVSAARIAASDVLVKGEDNAGVRFGGGSMLEVAAVVKVRSILRLDRARAFLLYYSSRRMYAT